MKSSGSFDPAVAVHSPLRAPEEASQRSSEITSASGLRTFCVIPTYRAAATIVDVVDSVLPHVDGVIVVDDQCPEGSANVAEVAFANNPVVLVVRRKQNGGVGAATKDGISVALDAGADIIVKIDADGQMDVSFIPIMKRLFAQDAALVCIKGNRFFDADVIQLMPRTRLVGNAVLSLMAKIASGYWNIIDPTNGFLAFSGSLLRLLKWQNFADSYFFELSVLCDIGLKRLPILELEMPTIYTTAPSSLSISRIIREFPPKLFRKTLRRLLVQYFALDVNLGTLYLVVGFLLMCFGTIFGCDQWIDGIIHNAPRSTGTVMLAVLPVLMGFQLLLNALMFDVQFSQKTHHELLVNVHSRRGPGRTL